jgi:hypothetical protein
LPVVAAAFMAAWSVLGVFSGRVTITWPVWAGAAAYGLFHAVFHKPIGLYVFGHELTHALAAALSGYRVKSFTASGSGGHVVLSDTNAWVAIAPYCVPIYTLAVVAVAQIVRFHTDFSVSPPWCGFAVGFTFAFHAALTLHALRQRQPDLRVAGPFLSLVLILLANSLVVVLLMKALFPGWVSLRAFGAEFVQSLATIVRVAGLWAVQGFDILQSWNAARSGR